MGRTYGTIAQGVPRTVIAVFPARNILAVSFIFDGSLSAPISFSIFLIIDRRYLISCVILTMQGNSFASILGVAIQI